jgi:hypothetical protein
VIANNYEGWISAAPDLSKSESDVFNHGRHAPAVGNIVENFVANGLWRRPILHAPNEEVGPLQVSNGAISGSDRISGGDPQQDGRKYQGYGRKSGNKLPVLPNRFEFAGNEHARAVEQAWISVWAIVFLIISLALLIGVR